MRITHLAVVTAVALLSTIHIPPPAPASIGLSGYRNVGMAFDPVPPPPWVEPAVITSDAEHLLSTARVVWVFSVREPEPGMSALPASDVEPLTLTGTPPHMGGDWPAPSGVRRTPFVP